MNIFYFNVLTVNYFNEILSPYAGSSKAIYSNYTGNRKITYYDEQV